MGVDDEYKMVSNQDDVNEPFLETQPPITRSSYRKRNMFISIAIGAVIGAGVMFLFSILFGARGYTPSRAPAAATTTAALADQAPAVITETATVTEAVPAPTVTKIIDSSGKKPQVGVDPSHLIEDGVIIDCGHTPDEARAKGCVFDVMMQDWMPRPCYDEALSERYLLSGNWTWWADQEATSFIPLEQMRKGEHPVIFASQDYHRQHCIYAWEKMVRAIRNDWPLVEELISYDHVMHCRHSTLSKESEGVRGVRAPTAWTRCGLVKDWQGRFPGNSVSSIDKRAAEPRFSEWL